MISDVIGSLLGGSDTHVQQRTAWDCGLACAQMALRFARRSVDEEFLARFEGMAQPLWTIDICHILQRHGVRYMFYTLCTGVNPEHFDDPWYEATNIREDEQRVQQLFDVASAEAWSVEKRSLEIDQLLDYVKAGHMIVILINLDAMHCQASETTFRGHYIVLTDVDTASETVSYLDPSFSNVVYTMKVETLDRARRSPGTDQDVVVVFR